MYRDDIEDVVITEDYLIAGVLREKVPGLGVETLRTDRLTDFIWQEYLSHCPWLVTFRQTFFNDLVLSKVSTTLLTSTDYFQVSFQKNFYNLTTLLLNNI